MSGLRASIYALFVSAAWLVPSAFLSAGVWCGAASAATFGPPLLDITQNCGSIARRNVAAMSECIVAESEARAEILQRWAKFSDATADKCVKLGRKNRKYPYTAMAKCLAEPADMRPVKAAGAK